MVRNRTRISLVRFRTLEVFYDKLYARGYEAIQLPYN